MYIHNFLEIILSPIWNWGKLSALGKLEGVLSIYSYPGPDNTYFLPLSLRRNKISSLPTKTNPERRLLKQKTRKWVYFQSKSVPVFLPPYFIFLVGKERNHVPIHISWNYQSCLRQCLQSTLYVEGFPSRDIEISVLLAISKSRSEQSRDF